ncbi:MAG: hypothetical protein IJK78_04980 [Bacteroidales bacterium]|jgi:hypothetical protein|nr:hypothetical protein [Bacteroidales bacterium]
MKKVLLFLLPMFMMAFVSCSSMRTLEKAPAGSMTPEVRLNISLEDIEYLGESTISVSTRSYFGCIKQIDMVNGEVFDRHNNTTTSLMGNLDIKLHGDIALAAGKVIQDYPEADYFVPVSYKDEVTNLFLGKLSTKTMVIKAYKYKNK